MLAASSIMSFLAIIHTPHTIAHFLPFINWRSYLFWRDELKEMKKEDKGNDKGCVPSPVD
jgi:hypothetical protein